MADKNSGNNLGKNLGNEFLRQNSVDLKRYLPEFVGGDATVGNLTSTESAEHERVRLTIQDLFNNLFVETSTWALVKWEELLEITPDANDTLDQRRNRILLRLQSHQISTQDYMVNLAKRYCRPDAEVTLTEHADQYSFSYDFSSLPYDWQGFGAAVEMYKPAHLAYTCNHTIDGDMSWYVGAYMASAANTTIGMSHVWSQPAFTTGNYWAGVISTCNTIDMATND
jgi:uncharacterized protein YmfQ (DUF2313 family)